MSARGYQAADASLPRPVPFKRHGSLPDVKQLWKALVHLVGPPMVFILVSSLLSFRIHFQLQAATWFLAILAFIPFYNARKDEIKALEYRLDRSWPRLGKFLFFVAAAGGIIFGMLNYWYYAWPSYSLEGLRTYSEIDAATTPGTRLLDAGLVNFAKDSHVVLDLAMSYTNGDTYCVAPITTDHQRAPGSLASYDLWAAGVNCCSPGQANFHCGDTDKPNARQGLRIVDSSQLPFLQLAVQQAEAANNLQVGHAMFFTWVEDADQGLGYFFRMAFKNFIIANVFHAGFNFVCVIAFIVLFAGSGKDTGLAALDEH